jgi:hypothetical protein
MTRCDAQTRLLVVHRVHGLHAERPALQLLDGRLLGRDRLHEELALMTLPFRPPSRSCAG